MLGCLRQRQSEETSEAGIRKPVQMVPCLLSLRSTNLSQTPPWVNAAPNPNQSCSQNDAIFAIFPCSSVPFDRRFVDVLSLTLINLCQSSFAVHARMRL